jgi:hypothetical protein
MATFQDLQRNIKTVGDLRRALSNLPDDLPLGDPSGESWLVVRVAPDRGEKYKHRLGYLLVEEDHGVFD